MDSDQLIAGVAELLVEASATEPLNMSFADLPDRMVVGIVDALHARGVAQGAIASVLGMTIGGYRLKLRTLRERLLEGRPPTLIRSVHEWLRLRSEVSWLDVVNGFEGTPEDTLRGVLRLLVDSGLVMASGRGRTRKYRMADAPPRSVASPETAQTVLFREGPLPVEHLARRLGASLEEAGALVDQLFDRDGLTEHELEDGTLTYLASQPAAEIPLATHRFQLPADHPLAAELAEHLANHRKTLDDLLLRARALKLPETDETAEPQFRATTASIVLVDKPSSA